MFRLLPQRTVVSACTSAVVGTALLIYCPLPPHDALLRVVAWHAPHVDDAVRWTRTALLFSTPYILMSLFWSILFIFLSGRTKQTTRSILPPYPPPATRRDLFVILGEVHHPRHVRRVEHPTWLTIPERGLYTGVVIVGAIGSGKTTACMYPIVDQLLGYRPDDREKRLSALILEVKGDFCGAVRDILRRHGREEDYVEIRLGEPYRYNPLYGQHQDAYALAFGINSLMLNLFGRGDEPFWAAAQTNLLKFIILLHQIADGYVTLWDVYASAIDPDRISRKLAEAEQRLRGREWLRIRPQDYIQVEELSNLTWSTDPATGLLQTPRTAEADRAIAATKVAHHVHSDGPEDRALAIRREQYESVDRWFRHDWMRIEPKLRTSIVEGVSVFLSLFDDPTIRETFCPPRECYDPVANHDGRFGKPLPSFSDLIEAGAVCAVNFPMAENPGLARAILTLTKMDYQKAVLSRIPRMAREPGRYWRQTALIGDECHAFITTGEDNPSGDEKFSALQRQARCISVLATQSLSSLRSVLPGETWRTWLQTMRNKVFLTLSDDFSGRIASDLCGREDQLKPHYAVSESGQDAGVSMLTGVATAHRASVSASKSYHAQRDVVFEPKVFAELRNAQAIVLAYDGDNPSPAQRCYLKPHYLDPNVSYFDQVSEGGLS